MNSQLLKLDSSFSHQKLEFNVLSIDYIYLVEIHDFSSFILGVN